MQKEDGMPPLSSGKRGGERKTCNLQAERGGGGRRNGPTPPPRVIVIKTPRYAAKGGEEEKTNERTDTDCRMLKSF